MGLTHIMKLDDGDGIDDEFDHDIVPQMGGVASVK